MLEDYMDRAITPFGIKNKQTKKFDSNVPFSWLLFSLAVYDSSKYSEKEKKVSFYP